MADEKEKEPTPRAITYKQVISAVGKEGSLAAWEKIGDIAGAGKVPTGIDHDGSIDLTGASEPQVRRIDEVLSKAEEAKTEDDTKKRGK